MNYDKNKKISQKHWKKITLEAGFIDIPSEEINLEFSKLNLQQGNKSSHMNITSLFITLSHYHLYTAIQYYISSIVLRNKSGFVIQSSIMRYYATFYSLMGILESNLKGIITTSSFVGDDGHVKNRRSSIFLENFETHSYAIKSPPKGQQHESIAKWAFAITAQFTSLPNQATFDMFKDDPTYFSNFRNWENYSSDLLLEELSYGKGVSDPMSISDIMSIWKGEISDMHQSCYAEDCWTIIFIKGLAYIHKELLTNLPHTYSLNWVKESMIGFHKKSEYEELVIEIIDYLYSIN